MCARDQHATVDGWPLDDVTLTIGGEPVPGWFLHPPMGADPAPAVLYCHAHGNNYAIGRDELRHGRPALQGPYLSDLRKLGCAALCLEMPCFASRADPGESARAKAALWRGDTLFGQMLAELRAGLDFLCAEPGIDAGRIASLGISMGGTHAWWLAGA